MVFGEDALDHGVAGAVTLTERMERLSCEIPADKVVTVDVLPHCDLPVYTLESSSGVYVSGGIVSKNCRTAAWHGLRNLLDPSANPSVCLPDDDDLLSDLSAPHGKEPLSGGVLRMEAKDEIRARIGRSTDRGDAVVQAFWRQAGSWADVYGVIECDNCGQKYYKGRDACPACHQQPATEGEAEPYPAGTMRQFATVASAAGQAKMSTITGFQRGGGMGFPG
jgi:hypothetical protein